MNSFTYYNPVKVIFKENAADCIGEEVRQYGKKALLVSYRNSKSLKDTIGMVKNKLEQDGIEVIEFLGATANPTLSQANQGIELCKTNHADVIVGLGGGSVMDCAKVIAAGVFYDGDIANMIAFSHKDNSQRPPVKALPTIMVPTVPATGSEMNPTAVITDERTNKKSYVWAPDCLYPRAAIIDPALTAKLPVYQSACGAVDTIAHMTEAYFNGDADVNLDLQDRMQEGMIRTVLDNLPRVIETPGDLQARGVMMWASSIALNGWVLSGTYTWAPMHQMGHVLSARYGATHGATLGCMMLAWMRFFAPRSDNQRYAQFASRIFGEDLEQAAAAFENIMKRYGVQTRISEFGAAEEDIDSLTKDVVEVSFNADGVLGSSPALTEQDIKEIYKLSL